MLKDDEFSCSVLLKLLIAGTGAGTRMKLLSCFLFQSHVEQLLLHVSVPFFCNTFKVSFRRFVSLADRPSKRSDKRTHSAFVLPETCEDDSHCIPASSPR